MTQLTRPYGVLTEIAVAAEEYGLDEHTMFTNMVYNNDYFPGELITSIFLNLPKIGGTTKCERHRTISLMRHIIKLIIRVVMNRLRGRVLQEIAPEQYGFKPDKGTHNVIFVLRRMSEGAIAK